jgi:hypothetical protein
MDDAGRRLSTEELQPLIRICLQSSTEQPPLEEEVCRGLLADPVATPQSPLLPCSGTKTEAETTTNHVLLGYPDYPLYKRLSDATANWMVTGRCPVLDLPEMYMLNEQDTLSDRSERLAAVGSKLTEAFSLWECWSGDKKQATVLEFLKVYIFLVINYTATALVRNKFINNAILR